MAMWFRNLRIFRLPHPIGLNSAALNEQLARRPLNRCGSFDMFSRGWVYPHLDGQFAHALNGHWLVALGVEQKLLPATVIRQAVQERAAKLEVEEQRKLGRKELRDLRDRVTEELMPRAFTKRRTTWGWIDPTHGWLVVDAGSDARVDEFMEVMLASVDDLHSRALQSVIAPSSAMTDWLAAGDAPSGFTLDSDLELRSARDTQAVIRYLHHGLDGKEIREHLAGGKFATRLGMTWRDRISFVLTDNLSVKRLTFLDILLDEAEKSAETADELFDIDFVLMSGELAKFLPDLLDALGGELKSE